MSTPPIDPIPKEYQAPAYAGAESVAASDFPTLPAEPPAPPRETPGAFDLLILLGVLVAGAIVSFVIGAIGMSVWIRVAHIPSTAALSKQQMYAVAIPLQVLWYVMTAAIAVPVFRKRWKQSFSDGVHWNARAATSRAGMLIAGGILLSFVVQIASAKIKMPTTAPIYELFKNPALAWTATFFGIFVAPAAEELGFRGFLLPTTIRHSGKVAGVILTSAIFALLHAEQIGHAWAAVAILFGVSVVLCVLRLRFNSVAVSTLVHMSYNSVLFLAMIYATDGYKHFDKIPH